jgi:hypothetical protein
MPFKKGIDIGNLVDQGGEAISIGEKNGERDSGPWLGNTH